MRFSSNRRNFLRAACSAVIGLFGASALAAPQHESNMYGLIAKMIAVPGERDALVAILLEGVADMPGCLSYVVAADPADTNALWITEVWDSKTSHDASLSLPSVRSAIARGKPLIVGFGDRVVTTPMGGHGLARGA
ncbi:MAG TPA: putative quinol monooxygenase [Candidatus Elarobacter sp.]|nr:putative quinol monooxygenase [Candidatus Elarobacter sp.]